MEKQTYPLGRSFENKNNPAIHIYGDRFHNDQSLYEYVFISLREFIP